MSYSKKEVVIPYELSKKFDRMDLVSLQYHQSKIIRVYNTEDIFVSIICITDTAQDKESWIVETAKHSKKYIDEINEGK